MGEGVIAATPGLEGTRRVSRLCSECAEGDDEGELHCDGRSASSASVVMRERSSGGMMYDTPEAV